MLKASATLLPVLGLLLVAATSCSGRSGPEAPSDSALAASPTPSERGSLTPFLVPLLRTAPAEGGSCSDLQALAVWLGEVSVVGFGDPRSGTTDAKLERYAIDPERHGGTLERHLASLADGENLLFHLAGAAGSASEPPWLDSVLPRQEGADVVILIREVRPLALPGSGT